MATLPCAVARSVELFLATVGRQRHVEAAYVFGSQVRGTASKWSDIDVAVVSPGFSGDRFQERLNLMRLAAEIDDRIEPSPFTPEEFKARGPLASEILRTGVRVA